MLRPKVEIFARPDALAERFAEVLTGQVSYAVEHRSSASIAFSRPTPEVVFGAVNRRARLPKGRVEIFQVDERSVTEENDDRNSVLIKRYLPNLVADAEFHQVKVSDSIERDAKRYAAVLEERCGSPPVLDFVHLGLGPDGHTASLVPGDPVLDVTDRSVATTKKAGKFRRITLTYPVIDAARLVVFVVCGREKADAVKQVIQGDPAVPAARISNGNVLLLLDAEAASRI
jgi:6-phosphogluconolactonase